MFNKKGKNIKQKFDRLVSSKNSIMKKTLVTLSLSLLLIPCFALFGDFNVSNVQMDILADLVLTYLVVATLCFVVSQVAKNYSQVDKLWSIIPLVFIWIIAFEGGLTPKLLLMAGIATVWGIRLTYNFNRRGGYSWRFWSGDEDYRWKILMKNPLLQGHVRWSLFNFLFISFYQLLLLLMITLPMLLVVGASNPNIELADVLLSILFLGLVVWETVADQQQWEFQTEKHRLIAEGKALPMEYAKGFLSRGLWNLSRHPNYFAEQSIWVVFYLFSVVSTGSVFNWTMIGCVLLIILFQGSAKFSEGITSSKYPAYSNYQKITPKFIPDFRKIKLHQPKAARV
jgi:steroid 5-alpha reductase family enzyme